MIVIISHAHPSVSKGGAEVSAYTLYLGLRRLGISTAFIAMCEASDFERLAFDTSDEYAVPYQSARYDHFFHHAEPMVYEKINNVLEKLKPTALIFHHFLFLGINTIRRLNEHFDCRSVLVLHEFLAICQHHGQMVTKPAKRLCLSSSAIRCGNCFPEHGPEGFHVRKLTFLGIISDLDCLVSPSRFLAERFIQWGVSPSKMNVIENGLAGFCNSEKEVVFSQVSTGASKDLPLVVRPSHSKSSGIRVFGYFGQINPFKGVDLILQAIEILDDFPNDSKNIVIRVHGNIIGVSDDFKRRFDEACSVGLIDYVGPYDNSDVQSLMQACDYVLMASKWWENSPVVIQEAYAAKRPVIVPAIGGLAEKVENGVSGHHFIFNDARDLAHVLLARVADITNSGENYVFPRPNTASDMALNYIKALDLKVTKVVKS
jgi:glycosyltransferase involved in cell wall biosynthesis